MDNQTILHSYKQALERKDLKGALVQTGKVWPAGRGEEAGELHNGRCCSYTLNTRLVGSLVCFGQGGGRREEGHCRYKTAPLKLWKEGRREALMFALLFAAKPQMNKPRVS